MEEKPRTIKIYFCFLKREKAKVERSVGVLPGPGWEPPGGCWREPASRQLEVKGGGHG